MTSSLENKSISLCWLLSVLIYPGCSGRWILISNYSLINFLIIKRWFKLYVTNRYVKDVLSAQSFSFFNFFPFHELPKVCLSFYSFLYFFYFSYHCIQLLFAYCLLFTPQFSHFDHFFLPWIIKLLPIFFFKKSKIYRPFFWRTARFPSVRKATVPIILTSTSVILLFSIYYCKTLAANSEIFPLFDRVCAPISSTKQGLYFFGSVLIALRAWLLKNPFSQELLVKRVVTKGLKNLA